MHREQFCPYCAGRLTVKSQQGFRRLTCERCRLPLRKNPVPATCVVVADGHHQILLVRREVAPKIGQWCLPGGFMHLGESPEQAALRKLKEDTGLSGKIELLLGVTVHPGETVDTVLMIGYLVKRINGEPKPGEEGSRLAWYHPDRLPPIAFRSHRHFIRLYYAADAG
jgi:ADP-ribose pyrophosphatase YjhB (NUDIX family)